MGLHSYMHICCICTYCIHTCIFAYIYLCAAPESNDAAFMSVCVYLKVMLCTPIFMVTVLKTGTSELFEGLFYSIGFFLMLHLSCGNTRDSTVTKSNMSGFDSHASLKYVRAGMLKTPELSDIESNIRELFDLCRRCGRAGHFAAGCRNTKDRSGRLIRGGSTAAVCAF